MGFNLDGNKLIDFLLTEINKRTKNAFILSSLISITIIYHSYSELSLKLEDNSLLILALFILFFVSILFCLIQLFDHLFILVNKMKHIKINSDFKKQQFSYFKELVGLLNEVERKKLIELYEYANGKSQKKYFNLNGINYKMNKLNKISMHYVKEEDHLDFDFDSWVRDELFLSFFILNPKDYNSATLGFTNKNLITILENENILDEKKYPYNKSILIIDKELFSIKKKYSCGNFLPPIIEN